MVVGGNVLAMASKTQCWTIDPKRSFTQHTASWRCHRCRWWCWDRALQHQSFATVIKIIKILIIIKLKKYYYNLNWHLLIAYSTSHSSSPPTLFPRKPLHREMVYIIDPMWCTSLLCTSNVEVARCRGLLMRIRSFDTCVTLEDLICFQDCLVFLFPVKKQAW